MSATTTVTSQTSVNSTGDVAQRHLTDAIQALERLALDAEDSTQASNNGEINNDTWLTPEVRNLRERLRDLKLRAESGGCDPRSILTPMPSLLRPLSMAETVELRRFLELPTAAAAASTADRSLAVGIVETVCVSVGARPIFVGLVRCPWLAAASASPASARRWRLVCIYTPAARHLLSPASQHDRASAGVQEFPPLSSSSSSSSELPLLSLVDVSHFCLHASRPQWSELLAVTDDGRCLVASPAWLRLRDSAATTARLLGAPLRRVCLAQGLGGVSASRRSRRGLRLRQDASAADLCASVRLISHVARSLSGRKPSLAEPPDLDDVPDAVVAGWRRLFVDGAAAVAGNEKFAGALIGWHDRLAAACDAAEDAEVAATKTAAESGTKTLDSPRKATYGEGASTTSTKTEELPSIVAKTSNDEAGDEERTKTPELVETTRTHEEEHPPIPTKTKAGSIKSGSGGTSKSTSGGKAARQTLLSRRAAEDEAALAEWRWLAITTEWLPADAGGCGCLRPPSPTLDIAATAGLPSSLLPPGLAQPGWRLELAACAGSRMYGLSTPASDVDYLLVYSRTDEFRRLRHPADVAESRGPDKATEFGACEAGEFARQLLRGSVVQLELLFCAPESRLFASVAFRWLLERRAAFATENFVRQLLGLAGRLVRRLREASGDDGERQQAADSDAAAEYRKLGKAAYQLEHKLNLLEDLAAAREPRVTLTGPERDRVLGLRSVDWADPSTRERLLRQSLDRHRAVRRTLATRRDRLPENCPIDLLTEWLQLVRGYSVNDPAD